MSKRNIAKEEIGPLLLGNGLEGILRICYEKGDVDGVLSILPSMPCKTVLAICQNRAHIHGNDLDGFKIVFNEGEEEGEGDEV